MRESLWALMPGQRKRLLVRKATDIVDQHLAHLIRVRHSGRFQFYRWSAEIDRFINSQVMVTLGDDERRTLPRYQNELKLFIAVRVA
jgi:hypothetical protein